MSRARGGLLASCCIASSLFLAPAASAQPADDAPPPPATQGRRGPRGPARSSAQYTLRRNEAGGPDARTARERARAGDCAGALPSFDAAIENTIEPTLRRDRGLCHEKLGHPFPAVEDYRAYLLAASDAPDADAIRGRLAALEAQLGSGGAATDDGASSGGVTAKLAIGGGAKASGGAADEGSSATAGQSVDYLSRQDELADEAAASPLRNGSGVVLGPFLHMPRFFVGDKASDQLGYGVGLALRYATGRTLSLISEIGYSGVGTSGAASSQAGPLLLGGAELRLPLSRFAGDHLLFRGGLGYERHVVSGTRAVGDILLGRFGVGYRHVFGPALGLELLADGGPAYVIPEGGESRINLLVAGSAAFLVGF